MIVSRSFHVVPFGQIVRISGYFGGQTWRRWTGIEPAGRESARPARFEGGEPTSRSDTSGVVCPRAGGLKAKNFKYMNSCHRKQESQLKQITKNPEKLLIFLDSVAKQVFNNDDTTASY